MRIFLLLILSITSYHTFADITKSSKVAIIIDDIGYRKTDSNVLKLPANITFSILPHTPYGKTLAEQGFNKNHEIMLHIPMEAENGKYLGLGGLTQHMDRSIIRKNLSEAFNEVPFATGMNNHMGSLLTTLHQPMMWVMQFLKEQNIVFIDSVTSPNSQASAAAKEIGVPTLQRNIFLDNHLEHSYITKQFSLLIEKAKEKKIAIAIAHPHPETIASLQKLLPLLASHNIELVSISALFKHQQSLKTQIDTN